MKEKILVKVYLATCPLGELITVIFWSVFKPYKAECLLNCLDKGMSGFSAFREAKKHIKTK